MIGRLLISVGPADEVLALDLLLELVGSADHASKDTGYGLPGFNLQVFTLLMPKHELRVLEAARAIEDRLQRVTAVAAILGWKSDKLFKDNETARPASLPASKPQT